MHQIKYELVNNNTKVGQLFRIDAETGVISTRDNLRKDSEREYKVRYLWLKIVVTFLILIWKCSSLTAENKSTRSGEAIAEYDGYGDHLGWSGRTSPYSGSDALVILWNDLLRVCCRRRLSAYANQEFVRSQQTERAITRIVRDHQWQCRRCLL